MMHFTCFVLVRQDFLVMEPTQIAFWDELLHCSSVLGSVCRRKESTRHRAAWARHACPRHACPKHNPFRHSNFIHMRTNQQQLSLFLRVMGHQLIILVTDVSHGMHRGSIQDDRAVNQIVWLYGLPGQNSLCSWI